MGWANRTFPIIGAGFYRLYGPPVAKQTVSKGSSEGKEIVLKIEETIFVH